MQRSIRHRFKSYLYWILCVSWWSDRWSISFWINVLRYQHHNWKHYHILWLHRKSSSQVYIIGYSFNTGCYSSKILFQGDLHEPVRISGHNILQVYDNDWGGSQLLPNSCLKKSSETSKENYLEKNNLTLQLLQTGLVNCSFALKVAGTTITSVAIILAPVLLLYKNK